MPFFLFYATNTLQINLPCIVFRSYFSFEAFESPPHRKSEIYLSSQALPLQLLASGHSLSSTSGPEQWLSSFPETGWPESRSKHARKRLWIETSLLPPTAPASEFCGDAESRQGEHCVHSDHSLRTTKTKGEEAG